VKTTKQMATIISKIAHEEGIDLTVCRPAIGAHFKIENDPYMPLSVEVIGQCLVSVTHYYEQNGDLVCDPDMVFYTGYGLENGWVPVSIQHNTGSYTRATEIENDQIARWYPRAQAQLTTFANMWARNIKAQGFLKAAKQPPEAGPEKKRTAWDTYREMMNSDEKFTDEQWRKAQDAYLWGEAAK
jgi:hypothetical protein